MKKFVSIMMLSSLLLGGLFAFSSASLAVTAPIDRTSLGVEYGEKIGLGNKDIRDTIAAIIKTVMGLLGIVAVVIVLIGGFYWMTAGGDEGRVETGKKWIFSGIIGLAIILSAYALTNFVFDSLLQATTNPNI